MNKKKPDPLVSLKPDKHRMLRLLSWHSERSLRELIDEAIDQYLEREIEKAPNLKRIETA